MTVQDILKLSEVGFSSDQIVALAGALMGGNNVEMTKEPQPQTPAPQPAPEKPIETPKEPEAPKEDPKPQDAVPAGMNEALAKMNEAANRIIASNIHNSNQPAQKSVDDILAEIINPPSFNS